MKDNIPTVEEFAIIIHEYHGRTVKRINRLGGLVLSIFGIMILTLFISIFFNIRCLLVIMPIFPAGIALVGLYIVISYYKWHKADGIFCNTCGKNLIGFAEYGIFQDEDEPELLLGLCARARPYGICQDEDEPLPNELYCQKCKKLIARTLNHEATGNPAPPDTRA